MVQLLSLKRNRLTNNVGGQRKLTLVETGGVLDAKQLILSDTTSLWHFRASVFTRRGTTLAGTVRGRFLGHHPLRTAGFWAMDG